MSKGKGILSWASTAASEISWLGAWSGFSAIAILGRAFPILPASAAFLIAAMIARRTGGRGCRPLSTLGLHGFAFAGISWGLMYLLYHAHEPPGNRPDMLQFITLKRGFIDWLIMAIHLFWTLLFYWGGVGLAKRQRDYHTSCRRFDLGLSAFFVLFLTNFLFASKGGLVFPSDGPMFLVFPFFFFGLFSIGMARFEGHGTRNFLTGYTVPGIVVSFAAVVILLSSGLLLFFLPVLHQTADVALGALRTTASPLSSLFLWVIHFLYLFRAAGRPEPEGPGSGIKLHLHEPAAGTGWAELAGSILAWGLSGLLLLLVLALVAVAVFYLVRWLLSPTAVGRQGTGSDRGASWLAEALSFLFASYRLATDALRPYRTASDVFAALSGWGFRSGCARLPCETPLEFSARLKRLFPSLGDNFDLIVNAFDEETYADTALTDDRLRPICAAIRRLRAPAHWGARLKTRLRANSPR